MKIDRSTTRPGRPFAAVPFALFTLTALVLAACGPSGPGTPQDTRAPSVHITSAAASNTAAYTLTGVAVDNVGVTAADYSVGGGEPQPLTVTGETFSVGITLEPGPNEITVRARDAAGQEGTASLTVTLADDDAAAPAITSLSAEVAAWGASLTVSGSGFGAAGIVTVGGAEAATTSWTDTEIALTVPFGADAGPAEVVVTTVAGSGSANLFVGVQFAPGTLDALAAAGHPPGTAVLLGAGTYTTVATEVVLGNLSLYGQGIGVTTINTGDSPKRLVINADTGHHLVYRDFSLISDETLFTPSLLAVLPAATATPVTEPRTVLELAEALAAAMPADIAAQNAADPGSLTFADVSFKDSTGGMGLRVTDITGLAGATPLYSGDIHVSGLQVDGPGSALLVLTNGDIEVQDSQVMAAGFIFMTLGGVLDTRNNDMTGVNVVPGFGGSGLVGNRGLAVVDSSLRSQGAGLTIGIFPTGVSAPLPFNSAVVITGSLLNASEPTPAAVPPDDNGWLSLAFGPGTVIVEGNQFIAQRGAGLSVSGTARISNNVFTLGRSMIAASTFGVHLQAGMDAIPSDLRFLDNELTWINDGTVYFTGLHNLTVSGNTFVSGAAVPTGTALRLAQPFDSTATWDVTVSDNVFRNFANALHVTSPLTATGAVTAAINNNHFDFAFTAAPQVALLEGITVAQFVIDANQNRWGPAGGPYLTAAGANGFITEGAGTDPNVLVITQTLP